MIQYIENSSDETEAAKSILRDLYSDKYQSNKLILLVGLPGSGKTAIMLAVCNLDKNLSYVNLGLSLSEALIDYDVEGRKLELIRLLRKIVDSQETPVVVLDNTEILFDQQLMQDPLRCLKLTTRKKILLAAWSGSFKGTKLVYGEINHPEYEAYDMKNLDSKIYVLGGKQL